MTAVRATGVTILLALVLAFMFVFTHCAFAGPIRSMEHYFRVSGTVNAANGACDLRADVPRLIELGAPYRQPVRDLVLEERMIDIMVRALNDTGERIQAEGHDTVCAELFALYGPAGTDVPGLISKRND